MVNGVGQPLSSADSQSMREDVSEPSEIHYSHFIPPPTAGMFLVSHSSFQYATGNRSASILRPSVHLRHPAAPDLSRELEGSVVCRSLSKEYREKLQQKHHEHTSDISDMCRSQLCDPDNDKTVQSAQAALPYSFRGLQLGS